MLSLSADGLRHLVQTRDIKNITRSRYTDNEKALSMNQRVADKNSLETIQCHNFKLYLLKKANSKFIIAGLIAGWMKRLQIVLCCVGALLLTL